MASSTFKSFLMSGTGSSYTKLVDIKSYPDLGGAPELLDATTLSDSMTVNVMGIQSLDALEFECNYTMEDYTKLKALAGVEQDYAVWFGGTESGGEVTPTGDQGKFNFTGELDVYVNGGGVNEVRSMTVVIAATSPITMGA